MRPKRYRSKKRKVAWLRRTVGKVVFLLISSASLGYLLLFAGFLSLKKVEVRGVDLDPAALKELLGRELFAKYGLHFTTHHLLWLNTKKLNQILLEQYPELAKISVWRQFPDKAVIMIEKREPVAVSCWSACYLVDKEGIIFTKLEQKNTTPPSELLLLEDKQNNQEPVLRERRFNQKTMADILWFNDQFERELKTRLQKVVLKANQQAELFTQPGWQVFFDMQGDVNLQFRRFRAVLEQQIPLEQHGRIEYIDPRFGERVYYKMKQ